MSVAALRGLCVDPFAAVSTTRSRIMDGLEVVVSRLSNGGVRGNLWIDGSFVTEKVDPSDVDVLLWASLGAYNSASTDTKALYDWVASNLKNSHHVDSYVWFDGADGESDYWRGYYIAFFGFGSDLQSVLTEPERIKGMGLIQLGDDS